MSYTESIDRGLVADAHNDMASEYDDIGDLWYPWLFAQIHDLVARGLCDSKRSTNRAVDVGCGTGFQSFMLAQAGYDVTGIDVATKLLDVARQKVSRFRVLPMNSPPLYNSPNVGHWASERNGKLHGYLERARGGRPPGGVEFRSADLTEFDFDGIAPDVIICCGSVLSFVDGYEASLRRMSASLARGGRIFLEVEQKLNADLAWPVVDCLVGGWIGYDQTMSVSFRNLFSRPGKSVRIDYPFELHSGEEILLPIWLFSVHELSSLFHSCGLRIRTRLGIHQLTNLLPSTVLHHTPPHPWAKAVFEVLRPVEGLLAETWPFWRLGCSVMYELEKL